MPLPDRPVSGASIESAWGQQVHDYTFAPAGCLCSGGVRTVTTTLTLLAIDTADEDPGGFVVTANDEIEVPTGGEGLYSMWVRSTTNVGTTGSFVRLVAFLNGAEIQREQDESETGQDVPLAITTHLQLSAGDILNFYGRKIGSGTNPQMNLRVSLIRVGAEYGAPS